jgi:hypothetical protein
MVQSILHIPWYHWVLNSVLNKVYRCVRCGYACCRIVAAASCVRVPACTPVSSVPVPDADALDMAYMCVREHKRGWVGVRTCATRGTRMGGCGAASP